jgi:RNA polymerase sigma-70 factor (ECF subfamily)
VRQSSEVIDVAERRPFEIGTGSERGAAFVRLADEHLDGAYRLARAILRDPSEAQDATHDAFVQAWRKWPTLRDTGRFDQWFDRILINTCRNHLQRAARRRTSDISDEVVMAAGDAFDRSDDHDLLRTALSELSPDHQIVVALRFYRDLPIDEIAGRLGVPPGTVHSRLHYALKRLHASIETGDREESTR